MKNKTLVGILIAALLIFNIYLLVSNNINKSKNIDLSDIKQSITNYILEYQGIAEHLLQNDGYPLDSILIVDLDNSVTDFNNLLKRYGDKIVVCRTSQYNCETCNDYAIQKLSILCRENPNIQVVILGYYDSIRSLKIVSENSNLPNNIHYYQLLDYDLPIEAAGVPYYFTFDKSLEVEDLFVPNRAYPKLTDYYLETILNKQHEELAKL